MASFLNQPNNPNIGGFKHYSGLLPANPGDGNPHRASVKIFHVPATNGAAIFRGDIVKFSTAFTGGDLPANIAAPGGTLIGNGGGSGLGNALIAPDVMRVAPAGATVPLIAGVVVGFGPITLYMAKNGFQYIPANTEAWVFVETDPNVEMYVTAPTAGELSPQISKFFDIAANAGFQQTRFGISGISLAGAPNAVAATSLLRLLGTGEQIGNDPTQAGAVAKVVFNPAIHFRTAGTAAL